MKQFAYKNNMIRHEMASHATKCEFCKKGFVIKDDLQDHIKESHEQKLFICDLCDMTFKLKCVLKVHKKELHEKTLKRNKSLAEKESSYS